RTADRTHNPVVAVWSGGVSGVPAGRSGRAGRRVGGAVQVDDGFRGCRWGAGTGVVGGAVAGGGGPFASGEGQRVAGAGKWGTPGCPAAGVYLFAWGGRCGGPAGLRLRA